MSKNDKDDEEHTEPVQLPRIEVVNELYDKFDTAMTETMEDKRLTFFEIEMAVLMLKEKLSQEKITMYMKWNQEENMKEAPSSLYR